MLPTPSVARRAAAVLTEYGCDAVMFGAAAPLGLLAPALRRAGAERIVALTHGHEAGWAALPAARSVLRRIGNEGRRRHLPRRVLPAPAEPRVLLARRGQHGPARPRRRHHRLPPGAAAAGVRQRLGIGLRQPVVVCVSRMVPRKGQDTLLQAWPLVRANVGGDPLLLLVGDGPYRAELGRLAQRLRLTDSVLFAGPVPWEELPSYYDAGNVFAMPCRTRRGGLDVEGLGIVYLEASATGLPVVGGDSGGAPDAILHGEDGLRKCQAAARIRWPPGSSSCCPTPWAPPPWARRARRGSTESGAGASSLTGLARSWPADHNVIYNETRGPDTGRRPCHQTPSASGRRRPARRRSGTPRQCA